VAVLRSKPMKNQCRLLCGPIELGARLLFPPESRPCLVRILEATASSGTLPVLVRAFENGDPTASSIRCLGKNT
ncbi:MAG: hypothetical protein QMB94_09670, partial [Phycisphaerales bacterium]